MVEKVIKTSPVHFYQIVNKIIMIKSILILGLTAVTSAEVLDIMFHDFPDKYEEFRKHVREKQAREASSKQKGIFYSFFWGGGSLF